MKIALSQMDMKWEDKEFNKIKAEEMAFYAKENNADFIIFPEMCLTGFSFNTEKMGEEIERSETIEFFKNLSKRLNINICFGMILKEKTGFYNKCISVNKNGEIIANYSKIHPFSYSGEDNFFEKGDKIILYKLDKFNISPFICYDLRFPEVFRQSCEQRDLITVIASWPKSRREHWINLLKARAIENQAFVIGVNRTGKGNGIIYSGDSMVINPNGDIALDCGEKEGVYFCEIKTEEVINYRKNFPVLKDRKQK